jgi:murein DD-endopeptidase MepM/ murein hydrolase activator NlpD
MLDARALRWRRLAVVVAALAVVLTVDALSSGARRQESLEKEVAWLRARLAEKRGQLMRQREEMAEVAAAVDRVVRAGGVVRERAAQARRLAHMEESREPTTDITLVQATFDGGTALVSEEASRALQQLAWPERQASVAADSIAVLTALLREPPTIPHESVPSYWPVRGLVTSPFGGRPSPYDGGPEMHPGIDIQARYGIPVSAGGDGEVLFAGRDPGYGGLVVIAHVGEISTLYAHLSSIYVREGQRIRRGRPIGAVGASGRATGAHLHYEVRVAGAPVDPRRYLVH